MLVEVTTKMSGIIFKDVMYMQHNTIYHITVINNEVYKR